MKFRKIVQLLLIAVIIVAGYFGVRILLHGFTTAAEPSRLETVVARAARNFAIPRKARLEPNPWKPTPDVLKDARESYFDRCAVCHAPDGSGQTNVGGNLYPRVPDLRASQTQNLTDGQLRHIIRSGVPLTGMPGWAKPHDEQSDDSWKLVLYIRSLRNLTSGERTQQASAMSSAHFTGSASCEKCHAQIYEHWRKTPMANVVRDPRESPDVIIPHLSTNKIAKFTKDQVVLVYGSLWKQRYFTKIGDDYYPEPAQWDVINKVWRPYFVPNGADWWVPFYPPDNMQRPTRPTCAACHSVDYYTHTKKAAQRTVGPEHSHGPSTEHVAHPTRGNILNPPYMDYVQANDTCIQCHSQGRPLTSQIERKYYDWPVGYQPGSNLETYGNREY